MRKELTSVKNPAVQAAKALQTAKGRREHSAFLCDGEHMTMEALQVCPDKVRTVFVDMAQEARFADILADVPATAEICLVTRPVMEAISQVKTPQGIAAVCGLPESCPLDGMGNRLVLLENVQDPGNVGTILRTLDAAGFDGCILTEGCADLWSPKTLRATMGSAFRVPVTLAKDGPSACKALHQLGYAIIGAELHGQPFYQRDALPDKLCLLIGNEGQGLTDDVLSLCDYRFKLPMMGGAESLNAAIAAAVMMYDIVNR